MRRNWPISLTEIFKHEGGYVDHPADPGGATNMGITHRTLAAWRGVAHVSKSDVRDLTRAEASEIYRARYALPIRYDDLASGLDHVTLDAAVNSGPNRAAKWLQRALGIAADGKVGPITIQAASQTAEPAGVIERAVQYRLSFMKSLSIWSSFGRGWSKRLARVEAVALKLTRQSNSAAGRRAAKTARKTQTAGHATVSGGLVTGGATGVETAPLEMGAPLMIGLLITAFILYARAAHHRNRSAAHRDIEGERQ